MPQLNNINVDNFQKDVFAVFDKYGVQMNEAFDLLVETPAKKHAILKKEEIADLQSVASPAFLKKFKTSVKQMEDGEFVEYNSQTMQAAK
ncbi:MAG: hypothetical protein LBN20_05285 [Endomicrobium sp.]|jgi:hypothetical protein|nr:hypothetical protein [Endomicrobium sp.]